MPTKLNKQQKRARLAGDLRLFVQKYARKAQKGVEPNDRRYDRDVAKRLKHLKPEELDGLLRDESDA